MLNNTSASVPGSRILGLGHYQPSNVVTNDDLVARGVDTNDAWIRSRVGIAERRFADPDETVIDMGEAAASKALAAGGVATSEVDLVIVATCTMPSPVPSAAPQLAHRLGIAAPGAYDVNSGCSGFTYSLNAASAFVLCGQARNVLVVASERFSGWIDFADRTTCVILADGSGAAVVGRSDDVRIGPVVWGSDGALSDKVIINPTTGFFEQDGQSVYRWATTRMAPVAREACKQAGVDPTDLAAFVPHQANLRIINIIAEKLGIPSDRVARDIVESGNTSAATIPLALSKMVERGEVPSGSPVLLLGFGSGLSFAGQVVIAP
jgi:3-oxoacyl-[acyl-carrier-protein] synthase III